MKSEDRATGLKVVVMLALLTLGAASARAQSSPDFTIGKKGEVHFNVPVKVGTTLLEPGMYQVQHQLESTDHILIFKQMEMPAGYRHSNTAVANEPTVRIKCRVEPAKKVGNTAIVLRKNATGEKEVAEVQVAGEAFKHLL